MGFSPQRFTFQTAGNLLLLCKLVISEFTQFILCQQYSFNCFRLLFSFIAPPHALCSNLKIAKGGGQPLSPVTGGGQQRKLEQAAESRVGYSHSLNQSTSETAQPGGSKQRGMGTTRSTDNYQLAYGLLTDHCKQQKFNQYRPKSQKSP